MISQQAVQDAIKRVEYHLFRNTTHMVCCLVMQNGFTVVGESACVNHSEFDLALGEKYAREDAERKVYQLLAFVEREIHSTETRQ